MQRRTRHDRHPNIDALMRPVTRRQSARLPKREGKRGGASVPESRPLVAAHDLTLLFHSPIPTHEPSRPARSAHITCRSGESCLSRHSCARPTDSDRRQVPRPEHPTQPSQPGATRLPHAPLVRPLLALPRRRRQSVRPPLRRRPGGPER